VGQDPSCDSSVYITVLGDVARLSAVKVETAEAPTIFLGGDSIVADYEAYYPYNPIINFGSWGQNLLQYVNGMAISDQAHGGMTTNCFRDDGHWNIISKRIRPGDVFMFQFGHNDQKRRYLSAHSGYAANLRWYIHQVRNKGAIPIIVTSISRIPNKDEQGYYDLLEEHAEACRKVGREWQVPVIDLHQLSFEALCRMEPDRIKGYFNDAAHTNDYGALYMSDIIASEIKRQQIKPLCDYMNNSTPTPWLPDESLRPAALISPMEKPEAPVLPTDLPELPYADCKGIPQYLGLKEAMAKGLLDPCLKFFHPFEEIPRGQFLYMFFKAAKAPDKRTYQGKYCDIYKYEWDAFNVQAAIDSELIDETTTINERFRPDDGLTCGELISFMIRNLHSLGDRNYSIAECEEQAKSLGLLWQGYEREKKVNRADCTVALVEMMNVKQGQIKTFDSK
jgi:lysophospholipase L1-like esterase